MNKLIYGVFIGLWSVACSSSSVSSVDDLLPGKYHRDGKFEHSSFEELLTIEKKPGQDENVFTVESESIEQQLDDNNKPLPAIPEKASYTGIYHPDKKMLELVEKGSFYSVDLEKGQITNGKITFERLK